MSHPTRTPHILGVIGLFLTVQTWGVHPLICIFLLAGGDSSHEPWSDPALQREVAGRGEELLGGSRAETRRLRHAKQPAETTQSHAENTRRQWRQLTGNVQIRRVQWRHLLSVCACERTRGMHRGAD